jgi:uncharacterized GH25 family protein
VRFREKTFQLYFFIADSQRYELFGTMRNKINLPVIFVLLFSGSLFAHDLWIEESSPVPGLQLRYGHYSEKSPHDKYVPFHSSDLKSLVCLNSKGGRITASGSDYKNLPFNKEFLIPEVWTDLSIQHEDPHHKHGDIPEKFTDKIPLPGQCSIILADFSLGYWTKTPKILKNLPKTKVKVPVKSWYAHENVKYIKSELLTGNDIPAFAMKTVSEGLEIIPLKFDKSTNTLNVRIFYNTKALAGVKTEYNGEYTETTDKNGEISIKLKPGKTHYIRTSYEMKSNSKEYDKTVLTSAVIFSL